MHLRVRTLQVLIEFFPLVIAQDFTDLLVGIHRKVATSQNGTSGPNRCRVSPWPNLSLANQMKFNTTSFQSRRYEKLFPP